MILGLRDIFDWSVQLHILTRAFTVLVCWYSLLQPIILYLVRKCLDKNVWIRRLIRVFASSKKPVNTFELQRQKSYLRACVISEDVWLFSMSGPFSLLCRPVQIVKHGWTLRYANTSSHQSQNGHPQDEPVPNTAIISDEDWKTNAT